MGGIKDFMVPFFIASFFLSTFFLPTLLIRTLPSTTTTATAAVSPASNFSNSFPVNFAYLLSASKGDVIKLTRVLYAIYHPANYYLLHLDLEASEEERSRLSEFVSGNKVFAEFGNVWIVRKSNLVTYRGPTMLSNTLHSMAILLRTCKWDWFINLSASDYPVVTQDDMIFAFSKFPRQYNFIHHTSDLGWKVNKRAKPIVIDPGIYSKNKLDLIWASKERSIPNAFKLFTGSAWMALSRSFTEYCIIGWDNLPRTLLLYYTNFISSPESYFQTVICNSNDHRNTTLNHDLHFVKWDTPPKQHPAILGSKDYRRMILSGAPFARKFNEGDPVLNRIDKEILRRQKGKFAYGGWSANIESGDWKNGSVLIKNGAGGRRLKALMSKMLSTNQLRKGQCR